MNENGLLYTKNGKQRRYPHQITGLVSEDVNNALMIVVKNQTRYLNKTANADFLRDIIALGLEQFVKELKLTGEYPA